MNCKNGSISVMRCLTLEMYMMHSMILIFYHEVMYFLLLDVVSMMGRLLHHLVQDRCQMFVVVMGRTY